MSAQTNASPRPNADDAATSVRPISASTGASINLHGHMPALDGVRGLAVSMVLVFHFVGTITPTGPIEQIIVGLTKYGLLGVDLFFVLSGFLITGILYDTHNQPHFFRNFYMRRALRIFPLYYGVLAFVFLVAPHIPAFQGPHLDHLVEHQAWAWLYGINIYIAIQGDWAYSYLNHFWSLAVEEHFYLFWPLIVFLLAYRPKALVAVALAVSLCAMLARPAALWMGASWWATVVLTPFRLDCLVLGAVLALVMRQPGGFAWVVRVLPRAAIVAAVLALATFAWTKLVSRTGVEVVGGVRAALLNTLLACLLIWALVAPVRSATSRFFCHSTMRLLGKYSYGLYVYHHFISYYLTINRTDLVLTEWLGSHLAAVALQATLGCLSSMVLAYLSYEFYEKNFLALKGRFEAAKA